MHLLLLCSALSAAAQSAREDIEAALTKFMDAFNSGNAAAVGQMYTDDAALLPPDGKRIDGRKRVEEFWQGAIKAGMKNLTLKALEVEGSGNLAYEVGAFTLGVPSKAATPPPSQVHCHLEKRRRWDMASASGHLELGCGPIGMP
ncbi:nuclear transport factor 2 family protein [Mesorhizobium sp. M1405]|uniref:YybH family protein n=1 Tax=Mesorhizobium sp. M1405 TaxID=2957098 RepID=UPI00333AD2CF